MGVSKETNWANNVYESYCWATRKVHTQVGCSEMKMQRWLCGKTAKNMVKNEEI